MFWDVLAGCVVEVVWLMCWCIEGYTFSWGLRDWMWIGKLGW